MCTYRSNVVNEPQASVVKSSRVQVHAQHSQLVSVVTDGRQEPLRHTKLFLENSPRSHQVICITVVRRIKPFQIRLQRQCSASVSATSQSDQADNCIPSAMPTRPRLALYTLPRLTRFRAAHSHNYRQSTPCLLPIWYIGRVRRTLKFGENGKG